MKTCKLVTALILTTLFMSIIAHAQGAYKETFILSGIGWFPSEAEIEKVDPFFGVHVARIKPHLRGSFDVSFSKVQETTPGVGSITGDDYFYGFSLDYLWGDFPGGRLTGPYIGAGGGYYWERVKWTTEVFSIRSETKTKYSSWAVEGMIGYLFEKVELFGSYVILPGSDNVTSMFKMGIGYYVGGER